MRKCSKCQQILPRILFGSGKRPTSYCIPCNSAYRKAQRLVNLEHVRALDRARWLKPERKEWMAQRRQKEENRIEAAHRSREWRQNNPELYKQALKNWHAANPKKKSIYTTAKIAALKQRTPSWLSSVDVKLMDTMNLCAKQLTQETGFAWCVDHVIPLRGKLVSGLHVPLNLHICSAAYNRAKCNSYTP